jgi:hypothetical protein
MSLTTTVKKAAKSLSSVLSSTARFFKPSTQVTESTGKSSGYRQPVRDLKRDSSLIRSKNIAKIRKHLIMMGFPDDEKTTNQAKRLLRQSETRRADKRNPFYTKQSRPTNVRMERMFHGFRKGTEIEFD